MKASRADWHRQLDFSKIACDGRMESMERAIHALLARRKNPMRPAEIKRWFRATPDLFVDAAIESAVFKGIIRQCRSSMSRNRCVVVYEADEGRHA
jgi:hypothetical protein